MKIVFDIDDTLWKITRIQKEEAVNTDVYCACGDRFRQVPDYELIQVLKWFYNNGDKIFVWSAGGIDYAKTIIEKLGLDGMVTIVAKGTTTAAGKWIYDIAFDDEEVKLANTNIKIKRNILSCSIHDDLEE